MKGNPERITSLADLAGPGVRAVLCFPKGCLGLTVWTIQEVLSDPADLFVARFTRARNVPDGLAGRAAWPKPGAVGSLRAPPRTARMPEAETMSWRLASRRDGARKGCPLRCPGRATTGATGDG
jgi:hypothetical protein